MRVYLALGLLLSATSFLSAADSPVVPAEALAKKWKRTKSLTVPKEKLRKGITVEIDGAGAQPISVRVDADTAESFQNIQFEINSANLSTGPTRSQLAEIARAMQMAGTESFLIEGHTCDLGEDFQNLELSQKRALAVKSELARLGVPAQRIQILGFGESDPAVPNTDEGNRSQNRRVQIFRKL